jgi:hypothetical protein
MSSANTYPDDARAGDDEPRVIPVEYIERRIYLLRDQKIMLDSDLADLYQVTTGNLNLAVKRNRTRFPADFMFQLTKQENASLLLQSAIAKKGRGGRQDRPWIWSNRSPRFMRALHRMWNGSPSSGCPGIANCRSCRSGWRRGSTLVSIGCWMCQATSSPNLSTCSSHSIVRRRAKACA